MIKHNITLTRQKGVPAEREITNTLKAAVTTVLRQQKIGFPCEVSLYLCREDEILRLNQTYRNIGTPTDVHFWNQNLIQHQYVSRPFPSYRRRKVTSPTAPFVR